MVSDYLRRPSLQALPSSQRTLMTLIMRKLLASSTFAIAGALDSLARKLERQLGEGQESARRSSKRNSPRTTRSSSEIADEWEEDEPEPELLTEDDIANIKREIADLRGFRDLAVSISENAKGQALLSALRAGFAKASELGSAEKAIIFTESRRTQEYLVRLLAKNGYDDKLVLFNGSNSDAQSKAIYKAWVERHKGTDRVTGSRTADMRAALVDYFRETGRDHDRDRGRGGGHQPSVLLHGRQLRPALEPAAHRTAHRALPPLRPALRRCRRQLPQQEQCRRPAGLRAARRKIQALLRRVRRERRGARARSSPASSSKSASSPSTRTAVRRRKSKTSSSGCARRWTPTSTRRWRTRAASCWRISTLRSTTA